VNQVRRAQPAQATLELALVVPGLLLGLFLITAVGLVARADGEVAGVAVEGARAGALVSSASDVEQAATDRATAVATAYGMTFQRLDVTVDASQFRRGGSVRVEVTYQLPLDSLPLIGWGTIQLQHQAVEPVDSFRSLP
jgi:Flp pilus assembly protein TadG